mmetsp:Transcript_17400/g.43791  ORF Transcript_17400/g.43791 Transcript_17400/m.43791 type:complete len:355 (-) Transcript_17400:320-1384(-)
MSKAEGYPDLIPDSTSPDPPSKTNLSNKPFTGHQTWLPLARHTAGYEDNATYNTVLAKLLRCTGLQLGGVDDAVHSDPHNVDEVPVQHGTLEAHGGLVVPGVVEHGGQQPDGAHQHVEAVEAGGDEEGGAVGAVSDGEGGGGVLQVLVSQEQRAQADSGAQGAHHDLGVLGHHGHVGRVVGGGQHGRHDQRAALPANGVNADRGPLHLDPHVGGHAQVHAGPQQAKEQRGLRHNEDPHAVDQVVLLHLGVHAHVGLNDAVAPPHAHVHQGGRQARVHQRTSVGDGVVPAAHAQHGQQGGGASQERPGGGRQDVEGVRLVHLQVTATSSAGHAAAGGLGGQRRQGCWHLGHLSNS